MESLRKYLLDAAGKEKNKIPKDNPYRNIAFDGDKPRLGWVKPVDFNKIKNSLISLSDLLEGKKNFIFIGMGGSINGIKPLFSIFDRKEFFTLDSLDPKAIDSILSEIEDLESTLVIAVSKSGTTKETQLLAKSLKDYYLNQKGIKNWADNFLWLTDPDSFSKLDNLGWAEVKKITIQPDRQTDIGGRFSAPHTQIFLLPLFLLLNQDIAKLERIYSDFVKAQPQIQEKALQDVLKFGKSYDFYFSPLVKKDWSQGFASWVVQLFQESLGSKIERQPVKTIVNFFDSDFIQLEPGPFSQEAVVSIMLSMYYYQLVVAYVSAPWSINFVNQEFVEKYKEKMRLLEADRGDKVDISKGNLEMLLSQISQKIKPEQRFVEVVLYFDPVEENISSIRRQFSEKFGPKVVQIFIGSDWNHQSYQAAFNDQETFYALACLSRYQKSEHISSDNASENIKTLKRIALATYQTLSGKSILYNLE